MSGHVENRSTVVPRGAKTVLREARYAFVRGWGIGRRMIGTAEAIAMTMSVIEKIFAKASRLWPSTGLVAVERRRQMVRRRPSRATVYLPLNVKSAVADLPDATVTCCVCVPSVSCQAVKV